MIVAHIKGHSQNLSDGYHLANGFNYLNCKILPIIVKLNFIWYDKLSLVPKDQVVRK